MDVEGEKKKSEKREKLKMKQGGLAIKRIERDKRREKKKEYKRGEK